jgi:hypothetical protein
MSSSDTRHCSRAKVIIKIKMQKKRGRKLISDSLARELQIDGGMNKMIG